MSENHPGFEVTVEHIQTYEVHGACDEAEAREAACRFAAGNMGPVSDGMRVDYGEMLKNEAIACSPLAVSNGDEFSKE